MQKVIIVSLLLVAIILGWQFYNERRSSGYDSPAWVRLGEGAYSDTSLNGLTLLGDKVIFKNLPLMQVDKSSGKKVPLKLGQSSSVFAACIDGEGHTYALCNLGGKVIVQKQNGDTWSTLPIPDMVVGQTEKFQLLADRKDVALVSPAAVFLWKNGQWSKVFSSANAKEMAVRGQNSQAIMRDGIIYVSQANETNGGVSAIELRNGKAVDIYSGSAVPFMTVTRAGKLWFITSEVGKSAIFSLEIKSFDDKGASKAWSKANFKPHLEASSSGARLKSAGAINWPYDPTMFNGLYTDLSENSILVATRDYGLLKFSNSKWEKLTPYWPDSSSVTPVFIDIVGLERVNDTVVIGIRRGGLVYYHLKKKRYSFWLDPALPK